MRKKRLFALLLLFGIIVQPAILLGEQPTANPLRLVRIEMDICGIGQFSFAGDVAPGDQLTYTVPLAEMSDVLRNLVIDDPENSIQYARVSCEFDRDETALRMPTINTFGDLLISMQGEQVDCAVLDNASITGRIISVERQPTETSGTAGPIVLTLDTESGIHCVELNRIKTVLPLRIGMKAKLTAALDHQVAANDEEYRAIEIGFAGQRTRPVSIRLTRPMPIWKATYSFSNSRLEQRLVFDNSTRQSWENVSIRFTDRSPVVFQTPLYQVVRSTRPVVLLPDRNLNVPTTAAEALNAFVPKQPPMDDDLVLADSQMEGFAGGGGFGGGMGGGGGTPNASSSDAMAIGSTADVAGDSKQVTPVKAAAPKSRWADLPADAGSPFAVLFTGLSVESQKTQVLTTPNLNIETERLSVYRREYHAEKPLASLQIINRMPFRLPAGPLTIFDDLGNAGEAMLMTMAPNVRQLVSYAIDGELEIQYELKSESVVSHSLEIDETHFRIQETKERSRTHEYSIENRSDNAKPLLIEHPKPADGWTLNRSADLQEETAEVGRYRIDTKAAVSTEFVVQEKSTAILQHTFSALSIVKLQTWVDDPLIEPTTKVRVRELLDLHQRLVIARKRTDDIATAMTLEKAEVQRITGLWGRDPFSEKNNENYQAKIVRCESRISELEAESLKVAEEGIALLKKLGSSEAFSNQFDSYRLDTRRWLDLSHDPFEGK